MRSPAPPARWISGAWRLLFKELSAFGVVGAVCLLIDLGVFQLLYSQLGLGAVTSRLVSTLVSMTVAYFAHRHWSFSHRARTGFRREYVLFAAVNGVTLLLGLALIALARYPLGQDSALVLQLVNVGSIGLGTVLRFVAYKKWIFPAADAAGAAAVTGQPPLSDPPVGERTETQRTHTEPTASEPTDAEPTASEPTASEPTLVSRPAGSRSGR